MRKELRRILYVEDDPSIQVVARMALEALGGFDVKVCDGGHQALEALQEASPDLILLDVMMPGMDGPTTLKALRERSESMHTPVIFMTAKVQPQEVDNYRLLGALDVVAKPFDPMTLAQTVRSIWERHQK